MVNKVARGFHHTSAFEILIRLIERYQDETVEGMIEEEKVARRKRRV